MHGTIRHPVDGCDDSLYERSIHNPRPPSTYSIFFSAMGRGGLSPRAQIYSRVTNNNKGIIKDKRINGKSLREEKTNGEIPYHPTSGKSPYGNKNSFLLKSLRKKLFHCYYSPTTFGKEQHRQDIEPNGTKAI